ncbi:unnamed protein product [Choristocarpus tenellus]
MIENNLDMFEDTLDMFESNLDMSEDTLYMFEDTLDMFENNPDMFENTLGSCEMSQVIGMSESRGKVMYHITFIVYCMYTNHARRGKGSVIVCGVVLVLS